jgi:predicted nuclease of predicted toxin-antitoxin system
MKFLANENVPSTFVSELKKAGYDILRIDEIRKGLKDYEVVEISFKERRILITFDKDFGQLIMKENKKVVGVILLRIQPRSVEYIKEKFFLLLKSIKKFEGKFIVVEDECIRERQLK